MKGYYPVAAIPASLALKLLNAYSAGGGEGRLRILARATGEKRPPLRGEWYLSGAIVEAYQAPGDLVSDYLIAELIVVETEEINSIRGVIPKEWVSLPPVDVASAGEAEAQVPSDTGD
jgi:hypothetical protein